jgi:hypothetical protein
MSSAEELLHARTAAFAQALLERVRAAAPEILAKTYRGKTDAFPFNFVQSFSRDAWNSSVDVCVEYFNAPDGNSLSGDIAWDSGRILADVPSLTIPNKLAEADRLVAIASWLDEFEQFLERETATVYAPPMPAK